MSSIVQLRKDTLANWLKYDPVLADGEEVLVATDATKPTEYNSRKVGNGTSKFSALPMLGYDCLQTSGTSTLQPMSQKATTDAIADGAQAIITQTLTDDTDKVPSAAAIKGTITPVITYSEDTIPSNAAVAERLNIIHGIYLDNALLLRSIAGGVVRPNYRHTTVIFSRFLQGNGRNEIGRNNRVFSQSTCVKPGSRIHVSWTDKTYRVAVEQYAPNGARVNVSSKQWATENFDLDIDINTLEILICVSRTDDGLLNAGEMSAAGVFSVSIEGDFASSTANDGTITTPKLSSYKASGIDDIKDIGIYIKNDATPDNIEELLVVDVVDGRIRQYHLPYLKPNGRTWYSKVRYYDNTSEKWSEWEEVRNSYRICSNEVAERYIKALSITYEYGDRTGLGITPDLLDMVQISLYTISHNEDGTFKVGFGMRLKNGTTGTVFVNLENVESNKIYEVYQSVNPIDETIKSAVGSYGNLNARIRILCNFSDWEANGGDNQNFTASVGGGKSFPINPECMNNKLNCPVLWPEIETLLEDNCILIRKYSIDELNVESGFYTAGGEISNQYPNWKHTGKIDVSPGQTVVLRRWFGVQGAKSALGYLFKEDGTPLGTQRVSLNSDIVDNRMDGTIHIHIPDGCHKIGLSFAAGLDTEGENEKFFTDEAKTNAGVEIYSFNYRWKAPYNSLNCRSQTDSTQDMAPLASVIFNRDNPFNTEASLLFKDGARRSLAPDVVPLIIVAGQSNADGRAPHTTAPEWLTTAGYTVNGYMMWNAGTGQFATYDILNNNGADSGTGSDGTGNDKFSFDPFFAKAFIDHYGSPLYAIRQTLGGIGIDSQPTQGARNYTWQPKINTIVEGCRSMCLDLLDKLDLARKWAAENKVRLLPVAILWHQGENDATAERLPRYKQNLANLISWMRGILGAPALPFINAFVNKNYSTGYAQINDIFVEMNTEDDFMKTVDMEGHYTNLGDNIHYDSAALQYMGAQMFEKYKSLNV